MARRDFLVHASAGLASLAFGGCLSFRGRSAKFKLAMAGYTLNKFTANEALAFCRQNGFRRLCVKDAQLPFDSTLWQVRSFRGRCEAVGIEPYGVGPIYMYSADEAKRYFDYAAALGAKLVVGVPGVRKGSRWIDVHGDRRLCEACSDLADEYGMRFAIHNHGRNPETGNPNLYPAVPETYEMIKDLSPRMGLCVDWAYTFADGLDCREVALKYRDRIFDGHVRCISDKGNGSSGTNPSNRAFDYDGVFDALREIDYDGCLGLELANAFPDNPQWIAESKVYFEGLMR